MLIGSVVTSSGRNCIGLCLMLVLMCNVIMECLVMTVVEAVKEGDLSQMKILPEFLHITVKLTLSKLRKIEVIQCCALLMRAFKYLVFEIAWLLFLELVNLSQSVNGILIPTIKLAAVAAYLMNVILLEGLKHVERESEEESTNGTILSRVIMRWFMASSKTLKHEQNGMDSIPLKILPENKYCHSSPKMGAEGVGFLKKLGYSQRSFNKSVATFVRNIIVIVMMFQAFHSTGAVKVKTNLKCAFQEKLSLIGFNHDVTIGDDWEIASYSHQKIRIVDVRKKKLRDKRFKVNLDHEIKEDFERSGSYEMNYLQDNEKLSCFLCTSSSFVGTSEGEEQIDQLHSFESHSIEFGLDSYSMTHVCNTLDLFIPGTLRELPGLGIDGIGGTSQVSKLGSVQIEIVDDSGDRSHILLENVAYIPGCPKNLISISQWSKEREDDCGLFCRGMHLIFLWDHDQKEKLIYHSPNCRIPLLLAQVKGDNPYHDFQKKYKNSLSKEQCFFTKNKSPSELTAEFFKDDYLASQEDPVDYIGQNH